MKRPVGASLLASLGLAAAACSSTPSLVTTAPEPAGDNCEHGGTRFVVGTDTDGDGKLSDAEIESSSYACDGAPGQDGSSGEDGDDGQDGTPGQDGVGVITQLTEEPAGENCEHGGFLVETGPDADRDGVIDEVMTSTYACLPPPPPGSVVVVESEYTGNPTPNCPGGFVLIHLGYDLDGDGTLDDTEETAAFSACNATPLIDAPSVTIVEDCTTEIAIPVPLSDTDGDVVATNAVVDTSGSPVTATLGLDGVLRIPAGAHRSGAILTVSATDNHGATTERRMVVSFAGTGCLRTDAFYGVQPQTCVEIEVNDLAGDDRGGVVPTQRYAFYNGDNGLVRANLDLTGAERVSSSLIDTLISDPVSGRLYTLWSSSFTYTSLTEVTGNDLESCCGTVVLDQLAEVDEETLAIGQKVTLAAPVPKASGFVTLDVGEGSADFDVGDVLLAMYDNRLVVGIYGYSAATFVNAIQMRLIDVVSGADLSARVSTSDAADFADHNWATQEVDFQHYLLLERDGAYFVTYRRSSDGHWVEENVQTGELVTRSSSFADFADVQNLALDASGLFAYFHGEGGFMSYTSESMTYCLIQFEPNDGSIDDRGTSDGD